MVQNTQNRDAKAIHLKLNELIHALSNAHNELIDVKKLSDEALKSLDTDYERTRRVSKAGQIRVRSRCGLRRAIIAYLPPSAEAPGMDD
jgi:low affinity Fe/Cu permease